MKNCFRAPRIFLPRGGFEKWAVPAADSHPDRDFWERVARNVGSAPSSLNCILPDVYSEEEDGSIEGVTAAITAALTEEKLERIGRGFVLTERNLKGGVRTGIVAALDLEEFSFARGEVSPARATEGPSPRVKALLELRRKALLEFPHTLLIYRDKKCRLIRDLNGLDLEILYDFPLMEEGGNIRGSFIPEEYAYDVAAEMTSRGEPAFAVADGHDELIAAKMYWEEIKPKLKGAELRNHPARYALVECINLYDPAVELFPVHRVVTETDGEAFCDYFSKKVKCTRRGNTLTLAASDANGVRAADEVISAYLRAAGGRVEYTNAPFSRGEEGTAVLLRPMEKEDLFYELKGGELLPKMFTVGEENKRYCLEGREISYD